jgi:hypothetical protein
MAIAPKLETAAPDDGAAPSGGTGILLRGIVVPVPQDCSSRPTDDLPRDDLVQTDVGLRRTDVGTFPLRKPDSRRSRGRLRELSRRLRGHHECAEESNRDEHRELAHA